MAARRLYIVTTQCDYAVMAETETDAIAMAQADTVVTAISAANTEKRITTKLFDPEVRAGAPEGWDFDRNLVCVDNGEDEIEWDEAVELERQARARIAAD